jgi:hypothetical protein
MADTTFRFRVDDSNVEQVMSDIANQIERTDQEYIQLEKDATEALQAIADNTAKTSKKLDEYAGQVEKTAKKTKEAKEETGNLSRGLRTLFGNISFGGVSVNDLSDSLGNLKSGLNDVKTSGKGAGDGAQSAAKGFGVLRLGAFALVAVVGAALVAAFAKFQKNVDATRVVLAQAKAVFDVSIIAVAKWGDQIFKAITGQKSLRDAIRDAKNETADFNIELRRQIELEGKIAKQSIQLERTAKEQAAFFALQKREIEALNLIADDTSKPFAQREAAAKKRFALSEQQGKAIETRLTKEIALAARIGDSQEQQAKTAKAIIELSREGILTTENLANRISKTRGANAVVTTDDVAAANKIFGIINELGDAQETLLGLQSESKNQLQGINNEQKQAAEQQQKTINDAKKRLSDLLRVAVDADAQLESSGRVLAQNFANATDEINKMEEEYTALSKLIGSGETEEEIRAQFNGLREIAKIDFEKADFGKSLEAVTNGFDKLLKKVTDPTTGNIADLVSSQTAKPLTERLRADGLEAGKALGKAIQEGQAQQAATDKEAANQQARDLIKGLAPEALNAFFEAEQARFELQIAQQDALIAKIQERLGVEKSALEEQQKLANEGLANDVNGAKKRVAEQERLLREGEQKKIEIERRAAKQRAIIAAGQQAVELTTAVAKLISAQASGGLVGLVLALGGIAIISRLMTAGRQQAASEAGRTQNFATGTERVRGEGTWTSDSVPVNLSKDERVIKSSDNARLGFERMSNKQLVHYALLGQRVHSDPLFAFAMGLRGQQSKLEESKLSLQVDTMKEAYKEAALMAADKQIDYWRTRPIQYRNEAGEMVTEWKEGNRVVRQIEVIQQPEI